VTAVANEWLDDDEVLLAALGEALRAEARVPQSFLEAARATFAWHNIDAELAALTYDSARDEREPALTRAEPAALRAFTFAARHLTIELHLSDGGLHGQVVPPQAGEVEVRPARGRVTAVPIDEVGYFTLSTVPTGPFRLYIRTADGGCALTDRISL
jgi:hypothetical protein